MAVTIEMNGLIAVVSLNRPPVNAVDQAMYREIRDTFTDLRQLHPEASVVVLRAEGNNFCGGNDLGEFATLNPENSDGRMQAVREAFWSIHDCPLPVVAAVQGSALGTGLCLAASCDVIIASENARFGLPEVSVGVMGGARHLLRLAPQQMVRNAFLTAEPLTGRDLMEVGGVTAVVERDRLDEEALAFAKRMARHSPVALRIGKRALNQIEHLDLKNGYELEQTYTGDLSGHPDSVEARTAMREKREPRYASAATSPTRGSIARKTPGVEADGR